MKWKTNTIKRLIKPIVGSLKWVVKYTSWGQEREITIIKNEKENLTIDRAKIK